MFNWLGNAASAVGQGISNVVSGVGNVVSGVGNFFSRTWSASQGSNFMATLGNFLLPGTPFNSTSSGSSGSAGALSTPTDHSAVGPNASGGYEYTPPASGAGLDSAPQNMPEAPSTPASAAKPVAESTLVADLDAVGLGQMRLGDGTGQEYEPTASASGSPPIVKKPPVVAEPADEAAPAILGVPQKFDIPGSGGEALSFEGVAAETPSPTTAEGPDTPAAPPAATTTTTTTATTTAAAAPGGGSLKPDAAATPGGAEGPAGSEAKPEVKPGESPSTAVSQAREMGNRVASGNLSSTEASAELEAYMLTDEFSSLPADTRSAISGVAATVAGGADAENPMGDAAVRSNVNNAVRLAEGGIRENSTGAAQVANLSGQLDNVKSEMDAMKDKGIRKASMAGTQRGVDRVDNDIAQLKLERASLTPEERNIRITQIRADIAKVEERLALEVENNAFVRRSLSLGLWRTNLLDPSQSGFDWAAVGALGQIGLSIGLFLAQEYYAEKRDDRQWKRQLQLNAILHGYNLERDRVHGEIRAGLMGGGGGGSKKPGSLPGSVAPSLGGTRSR